MSTGLQVLVVDDHATVREGLIRILTSTGLGWQVRDAAHAEAALGLVARHAFDVGVIDMSMPGMNGIELVRTLRYRGHGLPLLMLSMHADEAYALGAFKAGATGYITKDRAAEDLVDAVRIVAAGGAYVPPALAGRVQLNPQGRLEQPPHAQLSMREREVLQHLARGETTAEIAGRLQLGEAAVASAEHRMLEKLRLASTQELIDYAVTHRLLT